MAFRDSTRDFNRSRPEKRHASRSSSPRSFRSSNQNARANYNLVSRKMLVVFKLTFPLAESERCYERGRAK